MLLEVVVALSLFVFAATVISGGLNAAVQEVERLRLNVHASNLAISLLSELQMGIKPVESSGPEPFTPPFEMWTWQIEATPLDDTLPTTLPLQSVEVIVRHQTRPIVRRLTQYLPVLTNAVPESPSTNSPAVPSENRTPTAPES